MKDGCKASCADCESEKCHNKQSGCGVWAANGECKKNSDYMLKECPFSCIMCGIDFKAECRRDPAMKPSGVSGTVNATMQAALKLSQFRPRIIR